MARDAARSIAKWDAAQLLSHAEQELSATAFDTAWPPAVKIGGAWFCAPAEWIKQTGTPFGFQVTVGDAAIAERERQKLRASSRRFAALMVWC